MVAYIDSSVVLSLLLEDIHYEQACLFWNHSKEKVSSQLLTGEVNVVLQRYTVQKRLDEESRKSLFKKADLWLASLHLRAMDGTVLNDLRQDEYRPWLSQCRTLDAIHLNTALLWRRACDDEFYFFTFDQRLLALAKQVNFKTDFKPNTALV